MRRAFSFVAISLLFSCICSVGFGSSASALSGKCSKYGVVKSGKVCLRGMWTLTWQKIPVEGAPCVYPFETYKTLICKYSGGPKKWSLDLDPKGPIASGLTDLQVIDALRTPLAETLVKFESFGDGAALVRRIKIFESLYAAYGLKINHDDTTKPKMTIMGHLYCFRSTSGTTLYDEAC